MTDGRRSDRRAGWRAAVAWGAALGALALVPLMIAAWLGSRGLIVDGFIALFVLFTMGLAPIGIVVVGMAVAMGMRRPWGLSVGQIALGGSTMSAVIVVGIFASRAVETLSRERVMRRGEPIVDAIEAFERDRDRPPTTLDDLVPTYLASIPRTGWVSYPDWSFTAPPDEVPEGARWELRAAQPTGLFSTSYIVYWPDGVRPAEIRGYPVQARGEWSTYMWETSD